MKVEKVNWGTMIIVFIILILCMIVTLLPFVWMILTSLKDTGRVNLYSVKDISGKTVILKLCGSVYKDSICKKCI